MLDRVLKRSAAAAVITLAMAPSAFAQADTAPSGSEFGYMFNTLLLLISAILVMFMAIGFSMLEAGFVRSKNVTMQLTKNVGLLMVATLLFYLVGYQLLKPGDDWLVGGLLGSIGFAPVDAVHLGGQAPVGDVSSGADFLFQMVFCAATASIVSGTLAERMKLWPFIAFTALLTAFIYPIQASWTWGDGFLATVVGFHDLAGASVVHSVGGWAALAGAIVLGPRIGKYRDGQVMPIPASNITLASIGAFLLWVGWFGFNAGSLGSMDSAEDVADLSRIFVNTNLAAAGGAVTAMILTQVRFGSVDLTLVLNGMLAGLVSITAEPLMPNPIVAILIGSVGGFIVVAAIPLLDRFRIDDVVGAVPVHLFAGIWGTLVAGLTSPDATFIGQLVGIAVIGGFVFGISLVVWGMLAAVTGIRVSPDVEAHGLDIAELGLEAYPDFVPVAEH